MKKAARVAGIQYAALPWRLAGQGVEVMLVTSRETRRWVIPKGWPIKRTPPHEAAAQEAAEEAGVLGDIEDTPIGSYRYMKTLKAGQAVPVQVIVFPLRVTGQTEAWKEQGQRDGAWFKTSRAAGLVAEPALKRLISDFGRRRATGPIPRGAERLRAFVRRLLWAS